MGRHTRTVSVAALCALALAACSGEGGEAPRSTPFGAPTEDVVTSAPDAGSSDDTATTTTETTTEITTETGTAAPPADTADATQEEPVSAPESLDVQVVADGLVRPWDVQLLPDGTALVTERRGRLLAVDEPDGSAEPREVSIDLAELFNESEAGLMGMAVSPRFEQDRTIFLCHAAQPADGPPDVRVTRWTLDEDVTEATRDGVVVDGIPLTTGRHSGCRLLFADEGTLLVGTGDAADEANPQDLASLGGKVLAVSSQGAPVMDGGYVEGADPRILTYGHRNVQGLAVQPGTGEVWSVEHGPTADDEVNVLVPGGNYGWDPGPGYEEWVPMTDTEAFPDAVEAAWSSGSPTHATSGAAFLEGEQWGAWDGALAVAELKGSGVTVFLVEGQEVVGTVRPRELDGTYGRLRSLTLDEDGALWVTSSNGDDDVVLRVTPSDA